MINTAMCLKGRVQPKSNFHPFPTLGSVRGGSGHVMDTR